MKKKFTKKSQRRFDEDECKSLEPAISFLMQSINVKGVGSSAAKPINPNLIKMTVGTPEVDNTFDKTVQSVVEPSSCIWYPGAGVVMSCEST